MTRILQKTSVEGTPKILSISPSSATAGTQITIEGSNFEYVTEVQFGKQTLEVNQAEGEFTVIAPSVVSLGAVDVIVTAANGAESQPEQFTYVASPLLIRDNLNDTGGHSSGAHWISPDIICYGQDTLTFNDVNSKYAEYLHKPFKNSEDNNFYVRVKNLGENPTGGSVQLFYSPVSLFLTPEVWSQIVSPTQNGEFMGAEGAISIQPNEIGFTPLPFNFTGIPTGGHFCMIAIASEQNMTFPKPTSFENNGAMALWVKSNPNVSQRNMAFEAVNKPEATFNTTIGNNNNNASKFYLTVTPAGGTGNYPAGTIVKVYISDSRAPYTNQQTWSNTNGVTFNGIKIDGQANGGVGESLINVKITVSMPTGHGNTFARKTALDVNYYQEPSAPGLYAEEEHVIQSYTMAHHENSELAITKAAILLGTCEFLFVAS
ncbi:MULTISPECIES: IPT/TIG domain-containing protein [unclassified Tenacibaculum]|uniref:IPT/TIG domain-containing protein n=1 Tax=unclassified Tenacibaculum TaxID=2635139 RepID=UPI001F2C0D73|nr:MULTISPECIES: IPT/TIG domain-containing protein [unclassified Tenacibaculum]MCF2874782.1 IPT/TIG domain-containing protein [Tenacibaculum sp. Cn5-1]MCF2934152.1 IPT/TIG domain-containing protein [Tenacibaculum sp. Cn5-34]MCG7510362.1 IPT/TIG domain-containing protein [Tenacibaculum sp. Cn5-46]